VAEVILHVHKYEKKVTRKFKSGGLQEKHVLATWKLGNHISIRYKRNQNTCIEVAGRRTFRILTSNQQSGI